MESHQRCDHTIPYSDADKPPARHLVCLSHCCEGGISYTGPDGESHNKAELLLKCVFFFTLRKYVGSDLEQYL